MAVQNNTTKKSNLPAETPQNPSTVNGKLGRSNSFRDPRRPSNGFSSGVIQFNAARDVLVDDVVQAVNFDAFYKASIKAPPGESKKRPLIETFDVEDVQRIAEQVEQQVQINSPPATTRSTKFSPLWSEFWDVQTVHNVLVQVSLLNFYPLQPFTPQCNTIATVWVVIVNRKNQLLPSTQISCKIPCHFFIISSIPLYLFIDLVHSHS